MLVTKRLDILHTHGLEPGASDDAPPPPFIAIWYRCCHTYGRLYRNRNATMYVGRCPCCRAEVSARIGPDGTSRRVFEAR